MIAKEVGEYFAVFDPSVEQSKVVAEQIFLDLVDDARKKLGYKTNEADDNARKESPTADKS